MLTRDDLFHPPDRHHDECDGCHEICSQLWEDYDEPGEYQYCPTCIRKMEDNRTSKERRHGKTL